MSLPLLRTVRNALSLVGAFVLLVSLTPLVQWWGLALAGKHWGMPREGTLIVLGGGVLEGNVLDASTYWRCVHALSLWRGGRFSTLLVSGRASTGLPVSTLMKQFFVVHGVPAGQIQEEAQSDNTSDNARETLAFARILPGPMALVTSDYHMYRAMRVFRRAGFQQLEPVPCPDVIKRAGFIAGRWTAFLDLTEETAKIAYYSFGGRL